MNSCHRLVAVVCLLCATFLTNAYAAVFFSGHVLDSSAQPLGGVTVQAGHVPFNGLFPQFTVDGEAVTDDQGNYSITSLGSDNTSGQYTLVAQLADHVLTIYPGNSCFDPSCLTTNQTTFAPPLSDANFILPKSASIAGTVIGGKNTGYPIQVELHSSQGYFLTFANCDETGNYRIDGLPSGSYTVWLNPQDFAADTLLPQAYADHDFDDSRAVSPDLIFTQEGMSVTGIDFHLHEGATISGVFTSAINGAPLPAAIELERLDADANPGFFIFGGGVGAYTSQLIVPGTFLVKFENGDDYLPLFYPQVSTEAQAQQITIAYGQHLTGIDAQFTPTRSIAGTLMDAMSQQPIAGAEVRATKISCFLGCVGYDPAVAVSDASGNYLLQSLDSNADGYYIWAQGADGSGYMCQDYPDVVLCSTRPTGAIKVPLGATEKKTGIDMSLHKGSFASGRVYDPLSGDVSGSRATLIGVNGQAIGYANGSGNADGQVSDATGHFVTAAIPPGKYYLSITSPIGTILYPDIVCGNSACDYTHAQLIDMSEAKEYPDLDFVIPHLDSIFSDSL